MKKLIFFIMSIAVLAAPVFSQNSEENNNENSVIKKHWFLDQYFGLSIGAAGMKTADHGVFTTNFGVTYSFYLNEWISIDAGLLFHTEIYTKNNLLTNNNPMMTPLCFTVPIGVHLNIPKVEWLYTGLSIAVNIPIIDLRSPGSHDFFGRNSVFISLPVDFGFDLIKAGRGGSRVFIRVTPTFHKGGITFPVGFVWQIYNLKVFAPKVDVEVNVPEPVINIYR